eukprot:scaffold10412_cov107-Isochrysis_galbana.AAC.7
MPRRRRGWPPTNAVASPAARRRASTTHRQCTSPPPRRTNPGTAPTTGPRRQTPSKPGSSARRWGGPTWPGRSPRAPRDPAPAPTRVLNPIQLVRRAIHPPKAALAKARALHELLAEARRRRRRRRRARRERFLRIGSTARARAVPICYQPLASPLHSQPCTLRRLGGRFPLGRLGRRARLDLALVRLPRSQTKLLRLPCKSFRLAPPTAEGAQRQVHGGQEGSDHQCEQAYNHAVGKPAARARRSRKEPARHDQCEDL